MGDQEFNNTDKPHDRDGQIGERGSADRWNLKVEQDYRDALQKGAPGLIPEIDTMRAALQTGFGRLIPVMSNQDLIKEASQLNDRLFMPAGEVGPREKSAIAETLLNMHKEMETRLGQAPRDKTGLPQLDGVHWKDTSPLKGIVENIKPFGMVDQWGGFILPAQSETRSTKAAQVSDTRAPTAKVGSTHPAAPRQQDTGVAREGIKIGERDALDTAWNIIAGAAREGTKIGEGAKMPEQLAKEPFSPPTIVHVIKKLFEGIAQVHDRSVQEARALGAIYSINILESDVRKLGNAHIGLGQPYDENSFYQDVRHGTFREGIDRRMPYMRVETGEKAEQVFRQSTDAFVNAANRVLGSANTPELRRSVMQSFVSAAAREASKQFAK